MTLRPFEPSDADDLLECMGDSQVTRYCRIETMRSREEALKFIEEVAIPHPWFRAICVQGRAVGFIYVLPGEPGAPFQHKGDISYAVFPVLGTRDSHASIEDGLAVCVWGVSEPCQIGSYGGCQEQGFPEGAREGRACA
ncbi:hypothetical protein ACLOJK_025025 [Asimina triloba]